MDSLNKTFLPNNNYKTRKWYLIDCQNQKLGRLATFIVKLLSGKLKPQYYPSLDIGDYIVLVNADYIIRNKKNKQFFSYSPGRPGHSLKVKKTSEVLPQLLIERAVKRMLPRTKRKKLLKRLRIYNHKNHPHEAQKPIKINLQNLKLWQN